MESTVSKRNIALDVTKGLAIILVVFGHALETNVVDWQKVSHLWYFAAIHHFHMALFMFISGYLAYSKLDGKFLQRRFLQLIPTYIIWTIVFYFVFAITGFPPRNGNLIWTLLWYTWTLNTSGLWFLLAIFALYILFYLVRGNIWGILGIILLAYTLSQLPWLTARLHISSTSWFDKIAWFMPFFAGGYFISKYRDKLHSLGFIKWFCLVAFPVFFWLGKDLNYSLPLLSWPDYAVFLKPPFISAFYVFWMALLGIGMAFAVADLLVRVVAVRRGLQYLGSITLGIYCAHGFFRTLGVGNGIVKILTVTVVALLLSTALVWLLQRSRITNFIFLGDAQKLVSRRIPKQVSPPAIKVIKDEHPG